MTKVCPKCKKLKQLSAFDIYNKETCDQCYGKLQQMIICECGKHVKHQTYQSHLKTKSHIQKIRSMEKVEIDVKEDDVEMKEVIIVEQKFSDKEIQTDPLINDDESKIIVTQNDPIIFEEQKAKSKPNLRFKQKRKRKPILHDHTKFLSDVFIEENNNLTILRGSSIVGGRNPLIIPLSLDPLYLSKYDKDDDNAIDKIQIQKQQEVFHEWNAECQAESNQMIPVQLTNTNIPRRKAEGHQRCLWQHLFQMRGAEALIVYIRIPIILDILKHLIHCTGKQNANCVLSTNYNSKERIIISKIKIDFIIDRLEKPLSIDFGLSRTIYVLSGRTNSEWENYFATPRNKNTKEQEILYRIFRICHERNLIFDPSSNLFLCYQVTCMTTIKKYLMETYKNI